MPKSMPILERLLEKVSMEPNTGCWLFWGANTGRYGSMTIQGVSRLAHRVSYELHKGPIPAELHLDHLCKVTFCVNPDHLEPVTCRENLRRGKKIDPRLGGMAIAKLKRSQTHCKRGHEFNDENTYWWDNGSPNGPTRQCRQCKDAAFKRWQQRKILSGTV